MADRGTLPALPVIRDALRTPEARFAGLADFPYLPKYVELGGLRIAYIDEGAADADVILLMHGEPTWSFLYRKMIPPLLAAGFRVLAPDLVGFGRSDKPSRASDYSYLNHVLWMSAWLQQVDAQQITLFCQDWGSLIGLRMVVNAPDRFDRIVLANGGLPTGAQPLPGAFKLWRAFSRYSPLFPIGRIVNSGCAVKLSPQAIAAYDAPFPSSRYKLGARLFPGFVPATPTDPEHARNEQAWAFYQQWTKPFLTLFSTRDPITRGGEKIWQKQVPGAQGQPHAPTRGAGHFLQEDKGPELAQAMIRFIEATPR